MKTLLIVVFTLHIPLWSSAQDTLLAKPRVTCETVAAEVSKLFPTLDLSQGDSLVKLMAEWESYCGGNEASHRLDLLLSIYRKKLHPDQIVHYYKRYLAKFRDRTHFLPDMETPGFYDDSKGYFDFMPPGGRYDQWVSTLAKQLRNQVADSTDAYLLCTLFGFGPRAFEQFRVEKRFAATTTSAYFIEQYGEIYDWQLQFELGVGAALPSQVNTTYFAPAPQFDFRFSLPLKRALRLELGLGLQFPQTVRPIDYNGLDSAMKLQLYTGIRLGIGTQWERPLSQRWSWNVRTDLAFLRLMSNIRQPEVNPEEGRPFYGISTFDWSVGSGIRYKLGHRHSLGLLVQAHFAPLGIDPALLSPLGASYFSTGLVWRF